MSRDPDIKFFEDNGASESYARELAHAESFARRALWHVNDFPESEPFDDDVHGPDEYGRVLTLFNAVGEVIASLGMVDDVHGANRRYEAANLAVDAMMRLRLPPYHDVDTASSASRQHYIETGRYLRHGEAIED